MTRSILKNELTPLQASLFEFSHPEEALRFLDKEHLDLITTALFFEGMDGFEFSRQIRKKFSYNIKIVLISSTEREAFLLEGFESGMDLILSKNFNPGEIYRAVARSLYPNNQRNQILVIDDSHISLKILGKQIKDLGLVSHLTNNFDEAREKLSNYFDDILFILSDENVGRDKGTDFCFELKKQINTASIPFVLMSAESEKVVARNPLARLVQSYQEKPVSKKALEELVTLFQTDWISPSPLN